MLNSIKKKEKKTNDDKDRYDAKLGIAAMRRCDFLKRIF